MKRKWIGITVTAIILGVGAWWISSSYSLETVADRENLLRSKIAEHPVLSWVLGFFLYLVVSLVPGTRGKAIIVGWLYGFWSGVILVNLALTGAALIGYWISRKFIHDAVAHRYPQRLEKINRALDEDGAMYVVLLRVIPISFSVMNYLLGATRLRLRTYWWATHLGLLPGNIIFVNLGTRVPSLRVVQEEGMAAVFTPQLVLSLVLLSAFSLITPLVIRRFTQRVPAP